MEEMQPIFKQLKAEWSNPNHQSSNLDPKSFIFHLHTSNFQNHPVLCIQVSDFNNNTMQAFKTVLELEDMRERVGIGGNFNEFVDYLKDSFTSEDLKLVLEGQTKSGGAVSARVIAQKSEWMPTISITLTKLGDAAASEAMLNITLKLFELYSNVNKLLINEQQRFCELSKRMAAEQEKKVANQGELDGSPPSRALAVIVSCQEKNVANQGELDGSPPPRALAVIVSCQEKNVANQGELDGSPPCRALAVTVPCQENNVANQGELDGSPPSQALAVIVSCQEKNVANQGELDGSPPSRALAVTVPCQEKNVANQRELNAAPPSRASASSVSCQERNGAVQRELNASPPSWASASSVSCVERNDAIQRKLASSSTSRPPKFRKISDLSTPASQTLTRTEDVNLQDSSDNKRRTKITPSSNTNRVIPAYRRQKVEGVLLLEEED